jgi:hypothetical protein
MKCPLNKHRAVEVARAQFAFASLLCILLDRKHI